MKPSTEVLERLRAVVGPSGYFDQPQDIEPFTTDHRKLYRGSTPLVLRPDSTGQVSEILRVCNEARIGVVPVGGNTSYCGGTAPSEDGSQIVLSMARMRRIRRVDAMNFTLIAEAGCVLADVQAAAASFDLLFPMSLGSEGSCQLGGNLSTNAGGTAVLRYGMMRELVLGLEVVLPDGRVLDALSPLRKDNTGYDLHDLFIGAEGTLGVITAASCKLFSRPATLLTAFIATSTPAAAVALLRRLRAFTGDAVNTFELIPRMALDLVLRHIEGAHDPLDGRHEWYVLLEIGMGRSDASLRDLLESELAAAMEAGEIQDAAIAASESQREAFWRLRELIPEAQRREGAGIKHDVSVTTSELPRFISEASALVAKIAPEGRIVSYGHLGDGNLHFNVNAPAGDASGPFMRKAPQIHRAVHDLVAAYGGSFSAEHGIGRLKREELLRYKQPVAIDLMRTIKRALDPNGIMNPGKML
ncbi:MAG TPA: FAD-binding oxidoreductase [Steroidobacter sp.]|nr:FAD-binding oxidoreductase [Steroidobacter sp.]